MNHKKWMLLLALMPFCVSSQLQFSEKQHHQSPLLKSMEDQIQKGNYERITSILVAQNGNLVYEGYFNEASIDSKHNTRSATKTMATVLTGIAIKQGYIQSEKDRIFKYLDSSVEVKNPDPRKENISIEDLLTMSSILECDDSNSFSRGNEERMYVIEDWLQFFIDLPVRSYVFGPKPEKAPYGRVMSYCSAGAAALAEVVQSSIKSPVDTFFKEEFLNPLEIEDYVLHHTPKGTLNTAGGSEYRSRDLLKMIQLFLQKGKWKDSQILSEEWVVKSTTPKVQAYSDTEYGYLFWLKSFGTEKKYKGYYMSGNGGQKVLGIPELNLAIVITTTNYGNRKAHGYSDEIVNKFIVPTFSE